MLLCEALETLGDRYAIYGFSGMTRKRCEVYRVKRFDEPYDDEVRARISGIRPRDYTRMGVTIRHLTSLLNEVEARDYLPHMYGAVNYAVIDEVRKLPLKVSDIYRRLTT